MRGWCGGAVLYRFDLSTGFSVEARTFCIEFAQIIQMKYLITKLSHDMKIFLLLLLLVPLAVCAQTPEDEKSINKVIDELVASWNSHDFSSMEKNSTPDMNWINIVGVWWKDRATAVAAHTGSFNAMFNGVKFEKKSLVLRSITKDVTIANLIIHVGEFFPPDGVDHGNNKREAADDILTIVFVKKNSKWLITAAQNTVRDPMANR
jgi:uncharacterized protein (TIGR02246 family)